MRKLLSLIAVIGLVVNAGCSDYVANDKPYESEITPEVAVSHNESAPDSTANETDVTKKKDAGYDVTAQLEATVNYLLSTVPEAKFSSVGGEWTVTALAKSGYPVPNDYFEGYYERISYMLSTKGAAKLDEKKSTENSRLIIALSAIGKNPADICGYNLIEPLADFEWVSRQGINGTIFALIALDSNHYELPENSGNSRQKMVEFILDKELNKETQDAGGFAMSGDIPDSDITAMVLQALAPYRSDPKVEGAIDRALTKLSNMQAEHGGFTSFGTFNAVSTAQVIISLLELDIDPVTDIRFIKDNGNPITALLQFFVEDGGFKHILAQNTPDSMATDQSAYALALYNNFNNTVSAAKSSDYSLNEQSNCIGEGERTFKLLITDSNNGITEYVVRTDEETIGSALLKLGIIDGETGEHGLYVKYVNGLRADYDIDRAYWAFYIDGQYAMSGVDTTNILQESIYEFIYTKA